MPSSRPSASRPGRAGPSPTMVSASGRGVGGHGADQAVHTVPVADEADEAEHKRGGARRRGGEGAVQHDAVVLDGDAVARHAGGGDQVREHGADREDAGGGLPGPRLEVARDAAEAEVAVPGAFGGEGGVDLEEQRQAGAPRQAGAGEIVEVVAFVDQFRLEGGAGGGQATIGGDVVGEFGDLAGGTRQQAAEAGDGAALAAEPGVLVERGTDDLDLVSFGAEGGHELVHVHALAVAGLDAVAVEDAHLRTRGSVSRDGWGRGRVRTRRGRRWGCGCWVRGSLPRGWRGTGRRGRRSTGGTRVPARG